MAGREPTVSNEEILQVWAEVEPPMLSASQIAEHFDLSRQAIDHRLRQMEGEYVESSKIGAGTGWWLTERGEEIAGIT